MNNLLPTERKKIREKSIRLKVVVVTLILSLGVVLLGVLFLTPSYIYSASLLKKLESKKTNFEKKEFGEIGLLTDEFKRSNLRSNELLSDDHNIKYFENIRDVAQKAGNGIRLTSFRLLEATEGVEVTLEGVADNRESLVSLRDSFRTDELYTDVVLPISSLAKESNISFVLRFKIKQL